MRGRKVNSEIEQWTHTPPNDLKHWWEGGCLPPIPNHEARNLDPVDPGRGGCQINGLPGLHFHQVLDHEEHVVSLRLQDQPHLRLMEHQPCQSPTEKLGEELYGQSVHLT
ncbi:unnamed protein product [Caretta caretta]